MHAKSAGVFALCLVSAVRAEEGEIASLRRQVAAQSARIQELEARLEMLEKLVAALAPPRNAPGGSGGAPPARPEPGAVPAGAGIRWRFSGFADVTTVYRSSFSGAGIATAFGSTPLGGSAEARLAEFRASGGHSRLNLRLETAFRGQDLAAYVETDFLGPAPGNVFAGSNSHPLRLRLYWVQWRGRRWELMGGQSWSLLAPNRRGVSPDPADIMSTLLIDPNYSVGLVWTRQATVRVTRKWERFTMAAALENPEQSILDPHQAAGDVRGLGSRTAPGSNVRPDFLVKLAYDHRSTHLEVAAVGRSFQAYSPRLGTKRQAAGLGVSLAGVVGAGRMVDVVSQNYLSAGGGRYAQGLAPDVVVRPDGGLARVFTVSSLQGLEWKLPAGVQAYGYYGMVYARRARYPDPGGAWVGFGGLADSPGDNRTVSQATAGFRHTFWREENRGALSYAINYSYLTRRLWERTPDGAAGRSHMIYTSFRYQLP